MEITEEEKKWLEKFSREELNCSIEESIKYNKENPNSHRGKNKIDNRGLEYATFVFESWRKAVLAIDHNKNVGWAVLDSSSSVDDRTLRRSYSVTFYRKSQLWKIKFLDHVNNQYQILINDWNEAIYTSQRYENRNKLRDEDRKELNFTKHLDPGENTLKIRLLGEGEANIEYEIYRQGILVHHAQHSTHRTYEHKILF